MWAKEDLQKHTNFIKEQWVKWYRAKLLKEWDVIERKIKNSSWEVVETISWELLEILVDFDWNQKWFTKRIKISWYDEEFNPKKFKKVE